MPDESLTQRAKSTLDERKRTEQERAAAAREQHEAAMAQAQQATEQELRAALERAAAPSLATGYRIESQTSQQIVVVKGKKPNHILHLILSLLTLGLWAIFVWLPLSIFMKPKRKTFYAHHALADEIKRRQAQAL